MNTCAGLNWNKWTFEFAANFDCENFFVKSVHANEHSAARQYPQQEVHFWSVSSTDEGKLVEVRNDEVGAFILSVWKVS